ncbi:uncharacterized protein VTP21DRAFT_3495 [Calcarisporiella thermophila]|uniref:uncharacterized protein n=1 Tax=Calcarisporiella thermophila TaxID=911321 RepID=UPI00374368DA
MVQELEVKDDSILLSYMLKRMQEIIPEYVNNGRNRTKPVIDYHKPEELKKLIDLHLPDNGMGIEDCMDIVELALQYNPNSWNPAFLDKLYSGTNPIGVISELLLGVSNANAHVYHVSPVFTLMEMEVTRNLAHLFGLGESAGGIFCPGGSASNQLALITARNYLFPCIKDKGYFPKPYFPNSRYGRLVAFTSAHGHYSIVKAAVMMGLGKESVVAVPVDPLTGKMDAAELERLIKESIKRNETPFFVNATSGTTVLGAFDPLRSISSVCKKYGCWLHVDGSWGGSVIFSPKHKHLLDGSELADSITINAHKLLGVPLQCSCVIARDRQIFSASNSLNAEYLFHGNSYDLGDGTIGCGRRPDAVKFFLSWRFYGSNGFAERIELAFTRARYLSHLIEKAEPQGFCLVTQPQSLQVCFWYIPPQLQLPSGFEKIDRAKWSFILTQLTCEIHRRIRHFGEFMIDYSPLPPPAEIPPFFRVVINQPSVTEIVLETLVEHIKLVGDNLGEPFYEKLRHDI